MSWVTGVPLPHHLSFFLYALFTVAAWYYRAYLFVRPGKHVLYVVALPGAGLGSRGLCSQLQTSTRLIYVTFRAFDKTRQTVLRITITTNIFASPQSNNVAHAQKYVRFTCMVYFGRYSLEGDGRGCCPQARTRKKAKYIGDRKKLQK